MEFKKIDENRFQCLLMEEDLEDNNITLDDFFRNDTDKIHNLLEVVMEEAARNIDVQMDGGLCRFSWHLSQIILYCLQYLLEKMILAIC